MDSAKTLKLGYIVKMFPRLSETFILNEILELERQGVEVVIFSLKKPNEGRFHPQLSSLKARVIYLEDLDLKKWHNWISAEWSELSKFKENLFALLGDSLASGASGKVDYIWWSAWIAARANKLGLGRLHAHFASLPSSIAHLAHKISGIPYSFTAHAKDIFVYDMEEHLLREKLSTASFVVTVTNYNKRFLCGAAPEVDPDRIKVIHNGVDLNLFKNDDSIAREKHLILSVGRLVYKKGFHDLLDACAMLKEQNTEFQCLIVGDGPEGERLEQKSLDLKLGNEVQFVGPKNLSEVMELMQKATLFCLPCTTAADKNVDALPTVLLEALASGLPILSTNVSGVPEIVDSGVDGLLVDPDNPIALCEALQKMLASGSLRKEFAARGREKAAEKFDLQKAVAKLIQVHQGAETTGDSTVRMVEGEKIVTAEK